MKNKQDGTQLYNAPQYFPVSFLRILLFMQYESIFNANLITFMRSAAHVVGFVLKNIRDMVPFRTKYYATHET